MDSKMTYDSRVYTDIQGLRELSYSKDKEAAKKEVAQQFESLLMQMVLHSMRDASKALDSGLFGSTQMDMYQDMFDKQLALALPKSGLGFAEIVEKNIDHIQQSQAPDAVHNIHPVNHVASTMPPVEKLTVNDADVEKQAQSVDMARQVKVDQQKSFASPREFVEKLWPAAKLAANILGTIPEILVAQAALETNWGKSVLPQGKDGSSHNLFNIKAGSDWTNKTTTVASLEQRGEVLTKERADFRSYDSYSDSFKDYTNLLRQDGRYSEALNKAQDPEKFVHALQSAGFATDHHYASKIMKIFKSSSFKDIVAGMK